MREAKAERESYSGLDREVDVAVVGVDFTFSVVVVLTTCVSHCV